MKIAPYIARLVDHRQVGTLARAVLARPWRPGSARRIAVIHEPGRIAFSQIYPFILHAADLERAHDVQLRFFSANALDGLDFSSFDEVLLQLWYTRDPAEFDQVFEKAARGSAQITAFLDSFAHNDLRFASLLNGQIRYYLKKSLFRDLGQYGQTTLGHTNLTDYYSRAYGIEDEQVRWDIPDGFLDTLRLSPNFFTAPHLYRLFLDQDIDALLAGPRETDVHSRLGAKGTPWYTAMREHAMAAVADLRGVSVISEGKVGLKQFNAELQTSKMCFSPFGFGELCWRDIEAIAFGAVLLKPSMDHLRTLPELYEPDVTYVPLAWDFSDLAEKVAWVKDNPEAASTIARTAFDRVRSYLQTRQFVRDMGYLFAE
ncbi:glycosyltransferase [Tropicimonas sp. S265A]|uniref:glycosyltransferase n=1 Tax=Tropicimonas sp. S265A TaxID=3415134 RepID=UPI003C7DA7B3